MRMMIGKTYRDSIRMSDLNENWKPEFGTIYTWFAMDKYGKIAVFINNCFGDIPKVLLIKNNIEILLDDLVDYIFEESKKFNSYPNNKNGEMILDYFPKWRFGQYSKAQVAAKLMADFKNIKNLSDANFAIHKGLFLFQAVEGSYEGEDFPVGYDGSVKMGDYYRNLVPTIYGSIHDFPIKLRKGIVVSDCLDFTKDRILDNDKINDYFRFCADSYKFQYKQSTINGLINNEHTYSCLTPKCY